MCTPQPHQSHTDADDETGLGVLAGTSVAQAAFVSAQIAIARALSISLIAPMPPPRPRKVSAQAQYYLQQQTNLQAWIDGGGFCQECAHKATCNAACADTAS